LSDLARSFRVTFVVFAGVGLAAWATRNALAAYLMEVLEPGELRRAAVIPASTGLVFALRLSLFVAAVPLAAEGWLFGCRRAGAVTGARLWPAFCIATTVVLAGAAGLALHLVRQSMAFLVCFGG
jgi:hypothetical protein